MKSDLLVSLGLLVLRLSFGLMMLLAHGVGKLMGFAGLIDKFPDPVGLGSSTGLVLTIVAEVGCSVLIVLGLATRLAAVPLAFTMIVAAFFVHADDPWTKKELAIAYLAVYTTLFVSGGGRFALDRVLWQKYFQRKK